jgi:hypothetical protein
VPRRQGRSETERARRQQHVLYRRCLSVCLRIRGELAIGRISSCRRLVFGRILSSGNRQTGHGRGDLQGNCVRGSRGWRQKACYRCMRQAHLVPDLRSHSQRLRSSGVVGRPTGKD